MNAHAAALLVGCWNILSCAVCPGEICPNASRLFLFISAQSCWITRSAFSSFRSWRATRSDFYPIRPLMFERCRWSRARHVRVQNIQQRLDTFKSSCNFSYETIINVCMSWAVNVVVYPIVEVTKGMFTKEKHARHGWIFVSPSELLTTTTTSHHWVAASWVLLKHICLQRKRWAFVSKDTKFNSIFFNFQDIERFFFALEYILIGLYDKKIILATPLVERHRFKTYHRVTWASPPSPISFSVLFLLSGRARSSRSARGARRKGRARRERHGPTGESDAASIRDSLLDWEILRIDIQPVNEKIWEDRSRTWRSFGNCNMNVAKRHRLCHHLFRILPPLPSHRRSRPHTFDCEMRLLSFLKGRDCQRQAIDRAKGVWQRFFYWLASARVQLVLTRCVMCS